MVARALAGHPSISEKTRLRVQTAAREMGYHNGSNHEARALIAKRYGKRIPTEIIAVLTANSFFDGVLMHHVPYFAPFIRGIEEAAGEHGLDIYFCTLHNGKLPRLVEREGIDGVICLGEVSNEIERVGVPIINSGGLGKGWLGSIGPDHSEGAAEATRHLISLGHRNIACLTFSPVPPGQRPYEAAASRLVGYRKALAQAGLECSDDLIVSNILDPRMQQGATAMRELLARSTPFTAVVCFNDLIAMGAIQVLQEHGLRVPEDVSVVGFDDVSEQYTFEPKLTSIGFDHFAIGKRAVELIREVQGQEIEEPVKYSETFPVQLKVRNSTAKASSKSKSGTKTKRRKS